MNNILKIIILALGTFLVLIYIICMWTGSRKYEQFLQAMESPYAIFFVSGFGILDMIRFNYNSPYSRKMIKNCTIIYGKKYSEFYYRVHMAKKVSMTVLVLGAGLVFGVIMNNLVVSGFALLAAAGVFYYFETTITDIMNAREDSIISDFSEVLSKLALLVNAGMIVREAWEKISETGEGIIYEEMRNSVSDMKNGASESEAILQFSYRCNSESVTKFASTLVQNLSKGNKELVVFLRQFSAESWNEKKQHARVKGEEASGKLLIPIVLMFAGILVMIVVPIFMGISI